MVQILKKPFKTFTGQWNSSLWYSESQLIKIPPSLKAEQIEEGQHVFKRDKNYLWYDIKTRSTFFLTINHVKKERMPKKGFKDFGPSKLSLVNNCIKIYERSQSQ